MEYLHHIYLYYFYSLEAADAANYDGVYPSNDGIINIIIDYIFGLEYPSNDGAINIIYLLYIWIKISIK